MEATRKSFAAGLGEWDLQAVEWGHPQFKQKLLKVRVCAVLLVAEVCGG